MSSRCRSSLMLFSAFFSRWKLMLSEHLTISECRNLRFPMNSECQFSPDLLSRSNKVTLTDNLDGWQRFDWICHYFNYWREWVRIKCGMLSRWEQSCDTGNDRSSYHCSKNWTVWELDPDSDKWEHWHRKFIELCQWPQSRLYRSFVMAVTSSKTSMMRFALQDYMTMDYILLK